MYLLYERGASTGIRAKSFKLSTNLDNHIRGLHVEYINHRAARRGTQYHHKSFKESLKAGNDTEVIRWLEEDKPEKASKLIGSAHLIELAIQLGIDVEK